MLSCFFLCFGILRLHLFQPFPFYCLFALFRQIFAFWMHAVFKQILIFFYRSPRYLPPHLTRPPVLYFPHRIFFPHDGEAAELVFGLFPKGKSPQMSPLCAPFYFTLNFWFERDGRVRGEGKCLVNYLLLNYLFDKVCWKVRLAFFTSTWPFYVWGSSKIIQKGPFCVVCLHSFCFSAKRATVEPNNPIPVSQRH